METKKTAEKDTDQIIRYLTTAFTNVTKGMDRPSRTTQDGANELYKLQTAFAYVLHEIKMGPPATLQKYITEANTMIDELLQRNMAATQGR